MNQEQIKNIQQYGKTAKGKSECTKYLEGHRLTLRQAVYAHCYDCMGFYADGKIDCHMPHCSLHPFMPYNQNRIKRTKMKTMPENDVEMSTTRL